MAKETWSFQSFYEQEVNSMDQTCIQFLIADPGFRKHKEFLPKIKDSKYNL